MMMYLLVVWTSVFVCLQTTTTAQKVKAECKPYKDKFVNHTMCIYSAKACSEGNIIVSTGLTEKERTEMVKIHNQQRQKLVKNKDGALVEGQPKAKSMKKISWNSKLANIAQRAAEQCLLEHDKMRDILEYKVGQNMYSPSSSLMTRNQRPNMTEAALEWWKEVETFDSDNISPFVYDEEFANYTQMAWADTSQIGCGCVIFRDSKNTTTTKHLLCNYGPTGNVEDNSMYAISAA